MPAATPSVGSGAQAVGRLRVPLRQGHQVLKGGGSAIVGGKGSHAAHAAGLHGPQQRAGCTDKKHLRYFLFPRGVFCPSRLRMAAPLLAPIVWAQRKASLYFAINLPDVTESKIELSATGLKFSGVSNGGVSICWLENKNSVLVA
jgi:hypothetical protein